MSVRLRAQARLDRHVPDFARWDTREPGHHVALRDAAPPPARRAPSDGLPAHTAATRELRLKQPARPTPNAPLLMRVVRTPFALEPVRTTRRKLLEPRERVQREPLARPMRANPHGPEPRPRPFRKTVVPGSQPGKAVP